MMESYLDVFLNYLIHKYYNEWTFFLKYSEVEPLYAFWGSDCTQILKTCMVLYVVFW